MAYTQITLVERVLMNGYLWQGLAVTQVAKELGRHRSSIYRELARNRSRDGRYRVQQADSAAHVRRSYSRRNRRLTEQDWALVESLIEEDWSPEQVAGWLDLHGILQISHETIYQHIWKDKRQGGRMYRHLRQATKLRRKRGGSHDSRGRLPGKRTIQERPEAVEARQEVGHWEADTMRGADKACVMTLVERAIGYVEIGKLDSKSADDLTGRATQLIGRQPLPVRTVTADNGTEFHGYANIERDTHTRFYFATPYHAWERATSENTNGLIRQYLPKRRSMASLSQDRCDAIARKLNSRPRKRLGYLTPEECYSILTSDRNTDR